MQEKNNQIYNNSFNELDFSEIFNVLLSGKRIIISFTIFLSTIGVIYSLLLPNIYESKALLVPVKASSSISRAIGSYGGLAGIAGIRLPSDLEDSNSLKAFEKLSSLSFFENNILPNILLQDLMAVKSWNHKTNTLNYDQKVYNEDSNKWIRDYSYPQKQIPSAQESFEEFIDERLILSENKKTGFISISIKHHSPFIAQQWTELMINEVNNFYRQKDKLESEKAIAYLNQQIKMTGFSEIKEVIAELLQEETKKLTLVEANEFYVFDYIDPPAVMEEKSEPKRALICIFFALLGVMLSVIFVLIKQYLFKTKSY